MLDFTESPMSRKMVRESAWSTRVKLWKKLLAKIRELFRIPLRYHLEAFRQNKCGFFSIERSKEIPDWILSTVNPLLIPEKYIKATLYEADWVPGHNGAYKAHAKNFRDIHGFLQDIWMLPKDASSLTVLKLIKRMETDFRIPLFFRLPIGDNIQYRPLSNRERKICIMAFNYLETGQRYAPIDKSRMKAIIRGEADPKFARERYHQVKKRIKDCYEFKDAIMQVNRLYRAMYYLVTSVNIRFPKKQKHPA